MYMLKYKDRYWVKTLERRPMCGDKWEPDINKGSLYSSLHTAKAAACRVSRNRFITINIIEVSKRKPRKELKNAYTQAYE